MKAEWHKAKRAAFAAQMAEESAAVFFSGKETRRSGDQMFSFEPDRNFYYLTGLDREDMTLVILKTGGKVTEKLFIPPVNEHYEKWVGILLRKNEAEAISGISDIDYVEAYDAWLGGVLSGFIGTVYACFERVHIGEPLNLPRRLAQTVATQYPHIATANAMPIMTDLRGVKDPEEIEQIVRAIELTGAGLDNVLKSLKSCRFEYEARAAFEYTLLKNNARRSFATIAASGKNATILHYGRPDAALKPGELLLLDLGAQSNWYCADITRTYPVSGTFDERQRAVYEIVLAANKRCIEAAAPGMSEEAFNNIAKDVLAEGCLKLGLIADKKDVDRYYYHGIGHPLGLDTHDLRGAGRVLREGAVYTVEPGLYIAEWNIGVRIEDDIVVRAGGNEVLSKGIIKEIEDIERAMA